jgi:20S proteasome alpha/beta subunit
MLSLSKPAKKPYIAPTPKTRTKAVTIAIGMWTHEGIVLCSDSQITGAGYKYSDEKIFSIDLDGKADWSLGLTYSGDPEKIKSIFETMENYLFQPDVVADHESVKTLFETSLTNTRNSIVTHSDPDIDALCGFIDSDGKATLFTGENGVVSESSKWVVLGVGQASLTRYLQKILPIERSLQTIPTALAMGAYIIKQATDYVDGCGGNLQVCILRHGFAPSHVSAGMTAIKYSTTLLDSLLKKSLLFCSGVELFPSLDYADDRTMETEIADVTRRVRRAIDELKEKF